MNLGNESKINKFKQTAFELKEVLIDIAAILNNLGYGDHFLEVKDNNDIKDMKI